MGPGGEPSERTDTGIGLRPLGKRSRAETLPGFHDPEEEIARMIAFLFTFGLTAFLVVGGIRGSLHLRTHRVSTGRRLSGLQRSYAVPMGYKTTTDSRGVDETTRYTRKTVAISILILLMLSVIIVGALSTFIH
jgi:hypothetical protein